VASKKAASCKANAVISDCAEISTHKDFHDKYILKKTCYGRGDFFEIRQVQVKATGEIYAAKIFRKLDLCAGQRDLKDDIRNPGDRDDPDYVPLDYAKIEEERIKAGRDIVEKELKLLARLDHPNIVKILEAYEDKHKIYFIMVELKGGNLFDKIIRAGQFSETDSAAMSAYLVSIVKYLHKN
jgi:serine/threonine protein kinase